jgi:hypothetical protein
MLTLSGMPEGSDMALTVGASPTTLAATLKSFATGHGGATAVIEYVGRRGARILIVGQDGAWGDHFTQSTELARAACARAGVTVDNEWERELIEQMRPSNDLWRSMRRRVLSR